MRHSVSKTHLPNLKMTIFLVRLAIVQLTALSVCGSSIGNIHENDQVGELTQVHYLFRTGDRTPVGTYETDPYKDFDWPQGRGALTDKGKERLYEFGGILRARYAQYLENFLPKNVRSQSSPSTRVIESNLALLAGMFPPNMEQIWTNDTELARYWQPIAVEMQSSETAYRLGEISKTNSCPVADKVYDTIDSLAPVKELFAEHASLLVKLRQTTQLDLSTLASVSDLYDVLFSQRNFGLALPPWADTSLAILKVFSNLQFAITAQLPEPYLRLKAGPFLSELVGNLNQTSQIEEARGGNENKEKTATDGRRVFLYSTHDKVLGNILNALLGEFKEQTSFGSGLLLELRSLPSRSSSSSSLRVYMYYGNVTNDGDIYQLPLNGSPPFSKRCPDVYCSLGDFTASLEALSLSEENIERECSFPQDNGNGVMALSPGSHLHLLTFSVLLLGASLIH